MAHRGSRRRMARPFAALASAGLVPIDCDAGGSVDADAGSARCVDCHQVEYQRARRHVGAKAMSCAVCHRSDSWRPTILEHAWELTGAHAEVDCFACHADEPPVFEGLASECIDCHLDTLRDETFPDHQSFRARARTATRPRLGCLRRGTVGRSTGPNTKRACAVSRGSQRRTRPQTPERRPRR